MLGPRDERGDKAVVASVRWPVVNTRSGLDQTGVAL